MSDDQEPDGLAVMRTFAEALQDTGMQIHLAGHSTGAVLLGHLLDALDELNRPDLVHSCSLLAPACTLDFFHHYYAGRLDKSQASTGRVTLPALDIYSLSEKLEQDDNVAGVYRKSLLWGL